MRGLWLVLISYAAGSATAGPHGAAPPAAGAPRTIVVETRSGPAQLTVGSRTVVLKGKTRTFSDPAAAAPVVTTAWVRLLPRPFDGAIDRAWLDGAVASQAPDLLDVATDLVGRASYGPQDDDGTRRLGSDFNDYLGIRYTYPDGTVAEPRASRDHSLDCSGFVRLVYGYRLGVPMAPAPDAARAALPRRAKDMFDSGPGIVIHDAASLLPGDLVFFDASPRNGHDIDHVGIYLGKDAAGHPRFLSSRKSSNGPTLGDLHGASTLDGDGLYARSFRGGRRI